MSFPDSFPDQGDKYIDQAVESIAILDKILHNESKLAKTMFKMFAQYTLEDWKDLERIVNKSAEYIKMLETKDEPDENKIWFLRKYMLYCKWKGNTNRRLAWLIS